MNYKKSFLFSFLLSFFLVNAFFVKAEEASWFSMPEWLSNTFSAPEKINFGEIRDKAALYLGYVTALVLLEQGFEYCVHCYNKNNADHSTKFKEAVFDSTLNQNGQELGRDAKQKLTRLASEFRSPLYRYTIGLFIKNRIEKWLNNEIEKKSLNKNHKIEPKDLENTLIIGSY